MTNLGLCAWRQEALVNTKITFVVADAQHVHVSAGFCQKVDDRVDSNPGRALVRIKVMPGTDAGKGDTL